MNLISAWMLLLPALGASRISYLYDVQSGRYQILPVDHCRPGDELTIGGKVIGFRDLGAGAVVGHEAGTRS